MEHLLDEQKYKQYKDDLDAYPWLGSDHDASQEYPLFVLPSYRGLRGWSPQQINAIMLD